MYLSFRNHEAKQNTNFEYSFLTGFIRQAPTASNTSQFYEHGKGLLTVQAVYNAARRPAAADVAIHQVLATARNCAQRPSDGDSIYYLSFTRCIGKLHR
jgi:hypothetical protein